MNKSKIVDPDQQQLQDMINEWANKQQPVYYQTQPVKKQPPLQSSISSGTFDDIVHKQEMAKRAMKAETEKARIKTALDLMKVILASPCALDKDPKDLAQFAVLCADNLITTLQVTQLAKDKLDGNG